MRPAIGILAPVEGGSTQRHSEAKNDTPGGHWMFYFDESSIVFWAERICGNCFPPFDVIREPCMPEAL